MELTQSKVRELFDYRYGNLYWRVRPSNNVRIGNIAGSKAENGYIQLGYLYRVYLAHRLIWLWHFGEMPTEVDHIDGNPLNNRIENLRPATRSENGMNCRKHFDNKSGFKGVSWHKKGESFKH